MTSEYFHRNKCDPSVSNGYGSTLMFLSFKRVMRVLGAIAIWLATEAGLLYLLYVCFLINFEWEDKLETVLLVSGNILTIGLLLYWRHRRRDLWIKEEAERFLVTRRVAPNRASNAQYRQVLRVIVWIPSFLALSIFLFFPETMGIVSHLYFGSSFSLNRHRVSIPITWFVQSEKNLYVSVIIGKGIGRVGPGLPPLSSLYFYANPDSDDHAYAQMMLPGQIILSTRKLAFGNETLVCSYVVPNRHEFDPMLVSIRCLSSNNDFQASFYGLRIDEDKFFRVLGLSTMSPE